VSQAFQSPDQGAAGSVRLDPIKVICTEFPVVSYACSPQLHGGYNSLCFPVSGLCERQSKTASVADAAAQTVRHLGLIFVTQSRCPVDARGTLSVPGLGVLAPVPSWGAMLNDARGHLFDAPHMVVFPALAVMTAVL